MPSVLDPLLETQDHNLNPGNSLLDIKPLANIFQQDMEDGEGPRGQAQNTPYLQSQWRTAEHSYWSHTFHCTSTKGTEQGRQVKAGALWHTKAGKTKQFIRLSQSCWDLGVKAQVQFSYRVRPLVPGHSMGEFPICPASPVIWIVAGELEIKSVTSQRALDKSPLALPP